MKQALMMVAASLMLFCGGCMSDQSSEGNTDTELTDTFWVLKRIGDSDVVRAEGLEDPHMTLTATTLIFGPLGSTRMACEQLDQETAFLSKLVGPVTYRIRGNTLEIVDESGTVALSFEAGTNP
jgi:heat shock protein HslJ